MFFFENAAFSLNVALVWIAWLLLPLSERKGVIGDALARARQRDELAMARAAQAGAQPGAPPPAVVVGNGAAWSRAAGPGAASNKGGGGAPGWSALAQALTAGQAPPLSTAERARRVSLGGDRRERRASVGSTEPLAVDPLGAAAPPLGRRLSVFALVGAREPAGPPLPPAGRNGSAEKAGKSDRRPSLAFGIPVAAGGDRRAPSPGRPPRRRIFAWPFRPSVDTGARAGAGRRNSKGMPSARAAEPSAIASFLCCRPVTWDAKRGGALRPLLVYDLCCFVLCVGLAFWCTATSTGWALRSWIYWCRVIYGLLAAPFIVFVIPPIDQILLHTKRTAYNQRGRCVAPLSMSDRQTLNRLLLGRPQPAREPRGRDADAGGEPGASRRASGSAGKAGGAAPPSVASRLAMV